MTAKIIDRVHVSVHAGADAYSDPVPVANALAWLGIKHVRTRGTQLNGLLGSNVQFHNIAASASEATAAIAAGAVSVEGPNEPNNTGPGWTTAWQPNWNGVAGVVKGNVELLSSAMNSGGDYSECPAGSMSDADVMAVHCYRNNNTIADFKTRALAAIAGTMPLGNSYRPFAITESGWHDDTSSTFTPAADIPNQIVESIMMFLQLGALWVNLYELVDEAGLVGRQAHFGLFNTDWTPKPQAWVLRSFLYNFGNNY